MSCMEYKIKTINHLEIYIDKIQRQDSNMNDEIRLGGKKVDDDGAARLLQELADNPEVAKKIKVLDLSDNCISHLDFTDIEFDNLEEINVSQNQIRFLSVPSKFEKLRAVSCVNNRLYALDANKTLFLKHERFLRNNDLTKASIYLYHPPGYEEFHDYRINRLGFTAVVLQDHVTECLIAGPRIGIPREFRQLAFCLLQFSEHKGFPNEISARILAFSDSNPGYQFYAQHVGAFKTSFLNQHDEYLASNEGQKQLTLIDKIPQQLALFTLTKAQGIKPAAKPSIGPKAKMLTCSIC